MTKEREKNTRPSYPNENNAHKPRSKAGREPFFYSRALKGRSCVLLGSLETVLHANTAKERGGARRSAPPKIDTLTI